MRNNIQFHVYGDFALFTDPLTKLGGEKASYPIPTYQALKGIVESIYYKPTIMIVVDRLRVMKPIVMESKGVRPIEYNGGNTLANYTYLRDVSYKVEAHFEFNMNRPELANDRIEGKHYSIMQRSLNAGGRRDIFLGTRECQGYVEPSYFNEGKGFYDEIEEIPFGTMVHGINYPSETGKNQLETRLWRPVMKRGVIEFIHPEQCTLVRPLRKMNIKPYNINNIQSVDLLYDELIGGE